MLYTNYRATLDNGVKIPVWCCPDFGTVSIGRNGRWRDLRKWNRSGLREEIERTTKCRVTRLSKF